MKQPFMSNLCITVHKMQPIKKAPKKVVLQQIFTSDGREAGSEQTPIQALKTFGYDYVPKYYTANQN